MMALVKNLGQVFSAKILGKKPRSNVLIKIFDQLFMVEKSKVSVEFSR